MTDERGVSEVLGFVLVIAIVTMTIAVVMTTGVGGLHSSQQSEQITNMERGFDVLAHNVNELVREGAPSRATELRIAEGEIGYEAEVDINVTKNDEAVDNRTIVSEPIAYSSERGTTISYEAGAVIRTDGEHSTMLREPPFVIDDEHVIVHGVRTRPLAGSERAIDRQGTVLIRGEHLGTNAVTTSVTASDDLNITVTSARADAWAHYANETDGLEVIYSEEDEVEIAVDVDDATVHVITDRTRFTLIP